MKRNVSVVKLCLYVSECVCSKIIKELPGLVGSGTPCINYQALNLERSDCLLLIFLHTLITEKAIDLRVGLTWKEFLSSVSTCLTLHT